MLSLYLIWFRREYFMMQMRHLESRLTALIRKCESGSVLRASKFWSPQDALSSTGLWHSWENAALGCAFDKNRAAASSLDNGRFQTLRTSLYRRTRTSVARQFDAVAFVADDEDAVASGALFHFNGLTFGGARHALALALALAWP